MTSPEMMQELVALRALLKEALAYGMHADECEVYKAIEKYGNASEDYCNCWMFYALEVVVEAEKTEATGLFATNAVLRA